MTNQEFTDCIAKTAEEHGFVVSLVVRSSEGTRYMCSSRSLDEAIGLSGYGSLCARIHAALAIKKATDVTDKAAKP